MPLNELDSNSICNYNWEFSSWVTDSTTFPVLNYINQVAYLNPHCITNIDSPFIDLNLLAYRDNYSFGVFAFPISRPFDSNSLATRYRTLNYSEYTSQEYYLESSPELYVELSKRCRWKNNTSKRFYIQWFII